MSEPASYRPIGRLDSATAASHESALLGLLDGEVSSVTVDLSQLDYLSSAGLRVLLLAARAARSRGGSLVLESPKPQILEVLRISGFDRILTIRNA